MAALQPLATDTMPLDVPPPRGSRFGSPLCSAASIGYGQSSWPFPIVQLCGYRVPAWAQINHNI
jgi:hypothetical protein